jgi:enoyl-[acyl-carrier protein] reductase I
MDQDDVGSAAAFLLSDHAKAITGEVLYVDGGYNIMGAPDPAIVGGDSKPE